MTTRHGHDTDVQLVLLGRVARFAAYSPDELEWIAKELYAPPPELVSEVALAFASHDRTVEKLIDVAPPELVHLVRDHLRGLQQWSEAARLTAANTTVGTFHYQTFDGVINQGPAEWLTVTRDGATWSEQLDRRERAERGRYALAMFVATDASDVRAKTQSIPPHIVTRAVACASAYLAPQTR